MARTELEQLVYSMSADITKLTKAHEKALAATKANTKAIQGKYDEMSAGINKSVGKINVRGALDSIVDRTRLKVLDSGIARVGVFGSALEMLGPAGLAAAAGVVAVGLAFNEARGAAKFADEIQDTAARLHQTTDALQEFRYANFQFGGTMEGADQALEGFSEMLGKAEENAPKALKQFRALFGSSFTAADARQLEAGGHALDQVIEKIANLKSDAQKDASIDALGLKGMKPAILQGVDALEAMRQKAHAVGIVMDADMIQRGAEANKQFEVLTKVIDVQLKSAFIDLAPVLVKLLQFAAGLAREIADIVDMLRKVEDRTTAGLLRERASAAKDISSLASGGRIGPVEAAVILKRTDTIHKIDAELATRTGPAVDPIPHGSANATLPGKAGTDRSQQIAKASADAIAQAMSDELKARQALTQDVEQRLALELQQLQTEYDKKNEDLDRLAAEKKITAVAARQAQLLNEKTLAEKKSLATLEAQQKLDEQDLADREAIQTVYDQIASINSGLAGSAAQRRDIELRILKIDQDIERDKLKQKLAGEVLSGRKSQSQADAELAAQQDLFGAQHRQTLSSTAGPLEAWGREVQNINDELQSSGVQALNSFADAISQLVFDTHNAGQAILNIFKQLFAQIIAAEAKKELIAPALAAFGIPAFATGGSFMVGGAPGVDRNLVAFKATKGERVDVLTPGQQSALGSLRGRGGGSLTVVQQFHLHAEGAVMTTDLLEAMDAKAQTAAAVSARQALGLTQQANMRQQHMQATGVEVG